jgi:hypothetical protein
MDAVFMNSGIVDMQSDGKSVVEVVEGEILRAHAYLWGRS